ncbi:MAG: hypothetical protein HOO90_06475 [Methylotenera sp.]|uniref:hypothetical protein n=1 Tax=Methylotenera sp. TaxID=2051956 RepID=UPI0017936C75|nr:hypothetical protein [Methylotenera sp.]NOU25163.1 hypothetical protein [Methylotenera sp.]
MIELIKNYWWAIWAALVVTLLLRYRLVKRGGNELFLRRLLYAFSPNTEPTNEKRSKLSVWVVAFALFGVAVAMAANFYLSL